MRELLTEVHHSAWLATAVASGVAVACALTGFVLPTALAAMAVGALLMWISEEKHRLVAAMVPDDAPVPASAQAPAPAPVPAGGSAVRVREWTSPFPAFRPAHRARQQGRRTGGRRA